VLQAGRAINAVVINECPIPAAQVSDEEPAGIGRIADDARMIAADQVFRVRVIADLRAGLPAD
jgi:hypothetical protein